MKKQLFNVCPDNSKKLYELISEFPEGIEISKLIEISPFNKFYTNTYVTILQCPLVEAITSFKKDGKDYYKIN